MNVKHIATVSLLFLSVCLMQGCATQQKEYPISPAQIKEKSIIVLGIKQFGSDISMATKVCELTEQMTENRLTQAGFIVLDEGGMANYRAVAENPGNINWSKAALYEIGEKAGADLMIIVSMDARNLISDRSHPYNRVEVSVRMELLDINLRSVITTKYEKGEKTVNTPGPRLSDWQEAAVEAARDATDREITDIINLLMDGPGDAMSVESHLYTIEFERFQDIHVDAILSEMRRIPGFTSLRIKRQRSRLTVVQYFYSGQSFSLQTAIKAILSSYGYRNPRVEISGNMISYKNTTRF